MHGGIKFYRGSAGAARTYVEADRSRVDDYYLAEGTGVAELYVAGPMIESSEESPTGNTAVGAGQERRGERIREPGQERGSVRVRSAGTVDGDGYEQWVAGYDSTGAAKGRLRTDQRGLRFVEVVVNGPKTWSLAAALHPEVAAAYDAAQERAAVEIISSLAENSTTRIGPGGRQVQVPVDEIQAAVVRHHTSRAGDPHRHLHLQINARVKAAGKWRGLHSVGVVDSIGAINGIGHAAVMCDPELRRSLADHGYTLDPTTGEVAELAPYAGRFSARAAQINRNGDRYEATWRTDNPGQEPGPSLRRTWDRRAWSQARPDKVMPSDGQQLEQRWISELHDLGFTPPTTPVELHPTAVGRINRDAVARVAVSRLGARRSAWNAADIRGEVEKIIAAADVVTAPAIRRELVEDLVARTIEVCTPLLNRGDVPGHVRALTSEHVLAVEGDLVDRLAARSTTPGEPAAVGAVVARTRLDPAQQRTVAALAGTGQLVVVEGAAGAGKTTTLAAAREVLDMDYHRLVVATPTLKAAQVAGEELGTPAFSAAWLIYQHGFRWDEDGNWNRHPIDPYDLHSDAHLSPGDLLLVDEAGMLDQNTAAALLTIADETGARLALVGDRHQLPAVGRGGVLDHATRWAHPENQITLDAVHRFSDPDYADLTLRMRTGEHAGEVFDQLHARGEIVIHPTDVERLAHVTTLAAASPQDLVVADTREQVTALNAAIRDQRGTHSQDQHQHKAVTTDSGDQVAVGDRVATRRNDRDLDIANRDQWTVTAINDHGDLALSGRRGQRTVPGGYASHYVELAYATTPHGAQGETVNASQFLLGESTGAASAYVAMTRGRHRNTAHLVADTLNDARTQWIATFNRDRADLGPARARDTALETIDTYGPLAPDHEPFEAFETFGSFETPEVPVRRRPPPPIPMSTPTPTPGSRR